MSETRVKRAVLVKKGEKLADAALAVLLVMCKQTYSDPEWDSKRHALVRAVDEWRSAAIPGRISPLDTSSDPRLHDERSKNHAYG